VRGAVCTILGMRRLQLHGYAGTGHTSIDRYRAWMAEVLFTSGLATMSYEEEMNSTSSWAQGLERMFHCL